MTPDEQKQYGIDFEDDDDDQEEWDEVFAIPVPQDQVEDEGWACNIATEEEAEDLLAS